MDQSTGIFANPLRKVREFLYEGQMTKAADVEDYKKFSCCTGDQLLMLFADEASNVVWTDLTYFLNKGSAALSYSEQRSYRADIEVKIEQSATQYEHLRDQYEKLQQQTLPIISTVFCRQ